MGKKEMGKKEIEQRERNEKKEMEKEERMDKNKFHALVIMVISEVLGMSYVGPLTHHILLLERDWSRADIWLKIARAKTKECSRFAVTNNIRKQISEQISREMEVIGTI